MHAIQLCVFLNSYRKGGDTVISNLAKRYSWQQHNRNGGIINYNEQRSEQMAFLIMCTANPNFKHMKDVFSFPVLLHGAALHVFFLAWALSIISPRHSVFYAAHTPLARSFYTLCWCKERTRSSQGIVLCLLSWQSLSGTWQTSNLPQVNCKLLMTVMANAVNAFMAAASMNLTNIVCTITHDSCRRQ